MKLKNGEDWIDLPDTSLTWDFMTIQDTIDFANFAVSTNIETIRFQQKEMTVCGPIDILMSKPNDKPIWIKRKELSFE